jgi:hypothetical protein
MIPALFYPMSRKCSEREIWKCWARVEVVDFYTTALRYAQSLWRTGFPAKSLLLCNRAFSADLASSEEIPDDFPLPYHAVAWVIVNRPEGCFIGNPRRHYQHLATRMVEPRKELRSWRAWACWYLAKEVLNETEFPCDEKQIVEEGIIEPTRGMIRERLAALSKVGDAAEWEKAIRWITPWKKNRAQSRLRVRVRKISASELPTVRHLAPKNLASGVSENHQSGADPLHAQPIL